MNIYYIAFLTLFAAFVVSLAQLAFKRSVKKAGSLREMLGMARSPLFLLGILGYLAGLGIYLAALSGGELSLVYPLFASSFIFVTLLSALALKERVGWVRFAGILIIFVGIAVVAAS